MTKNVKDKCINALWGIGAAIIILVYLFRSMMGFRWPGIYVMTCHLVTSKYGFVPRTFISNILGAVVKDTIYNYQFLYVWILLIAFIFVVYIVGTAVRKIAVEQNLLFLFVILSFVISPHVKFFLHETGYFEQYGFLLAILLIGMTRERNVNRTCILSAMFSLVAVLISETNLFLIVPSLFMIAFLEISESNMLNFKRIIYFFSMFLPMVIYGIFTFFVKIPKERMNLLEKECVEKANFSLRGDVFAFFWNGRSNPERWPRMLHAIPVSCIVYPLLLIIVISIILWNANKKKTAFLYSTLCVLIGLFNYSVVIVAWDLHRFYWCIYMQVFIVTLYVLKRCLHQYKLHRHELIYLMIMIVGCIGMGGFEFDLFDGATYLRTIDEMKLMLLNYKLQ